MEKDLSQELIDETMSEEPAFTEENSNTPDDNVFKFDDVQEETPADSQPESEQVEDDSASDEDKEPVVEEASDEEEQRVPYSRFERKVQELHERDNVIQSLEARLTELETNRVESTPTEDLEVPPEWVELYGDSEASKKAFKIQVAREQQLMETATRNAIEQLKAQESKEAELIEQNTEIIEDNLSSLRQQLGKKFTKEVEEDVLDIVEEFSPIGEDGKYTSLFPFDKAYEIYELRNSKAQSKTVQARNQVANLTGNSSEGEVESSDGDFKRGWDNWRDAL